MNKELMIDLAAKAQNGDENALSDLLAQTKTNILKIAGIAGINDADVIENIMQEISENLNTLAEPKDYPLWMKKIANANLEKLFKNGDDKEILEKNQGEMLYQGRFSDEEDALPKAVIENKGLAEIAGKMIETLPEPQRMSMYFMYCEGNSVAEIAEIQGVSEEIVENRLKYARNVLGAAVEYYENKQEIKLETIPFGSFIQWVFSRIPKEIMVSVNDNEENTAEAVSNEENTSKGKIPLAVKIGAAVVAGAIALGIISTIAMAVITAIIVAVSG